MCTRHGLEKLGKDSCIESMVLQFLPQQKSWLQYRLKRTYLVTAS